MAGQVPHQADRGVHGARERFGEFGEYAFLHLGGNQFQHVVEQGGFAFVAGPKCLEKEVGHLAQQFTPLTAVGGARQLD